ncbi:MAG: Hpt domain-containing protein [Pseudomonadota bacterium]
MKPLTDISPAPNALYRELIDAFIAGLPAWMSGVRTAHAQQDWPELARAAHDMKGMGGGFGYPRLTELAATMEQAIKSKNWDAVADYASELGRLVAGITARANLDI